MNDFDIDFLLSRILSGYLIFFYQNQKYQLRYPTIELKYEANILYNNIINEEKYNDWIREENITKVMIHLGLWENSTDALLQNMDKNIDNLKVELYNSFLNKSKQPKIRESLRSVEAQKDKILSRKYEFVSNTLEGYAASIKNEYIITNTLYDSRGELVFKNSDNISKNSLSYQYFNALVQEINSHVISVSDFKAIARSGIWKAYWGANKSNVFDTSVINWTDEQRSLVNITKMYDSVYEHPECPDDKIIEDDDMLDGWMIVQKRKLHKQKKEISLEQSNPRLKNAQEVFLLADDQDDIEEILDMNSPESKMRMKEKFNFIQNSQGPVEELQLPDVRRDVVASLNKK
jgi:hypothetical protein